MQTNKPLPHLTIRTGPWAGTMVRFATVEQLRAVHIASRCLKISMEQIIQDHFNEGYLRDYLNAPQPKESH